MRDNIKFFESSKGQEYLLKIKINQCNFRSPNTINVLENVFKNLLIHLELDFKNDYQKYIEKYLKISLPIYSRDEIKEKLAHKYFFLFIKKTKNYTKKDWDIIVKEMIKNKNIQNKHRFFIQHIVNHISPCSDQSKYNLNFQKENSLDYEIKKIQEDKDIIPSDIVDKLFENGDEFMKIVIAIFITTGIRVGALSNIKKEDIDYDKSTIRIVEKGNKENKIHVNKKILLMMDDDNFFNIRKYTNFINIRLKKLAKSIGITESYIHPHAFRHTYAMLLIKKNIDILTVSELLGHSNPKITKEYYVKQTIADKQKLCSLSFLDKKNECVYPKVWDWVIE